MPDPQKTTISATESPALFHVSPYVTRWMLFQKFSKGLDIDRDGDARMAWGKKLQPLVLAQAAADLRLEVHPNIGDTYHRRGRLGATRDATIVCPDRGPGALETKCVFDYGVWARDWAGGKSPPRHYELQLQQQMFVGDEAGSYRWGVLAAWVCGEMHYFEREPLSDLWAELEKEAERFFDDVANGREPNAFGDAVELPLMQELFAVESGRTLDLSADPAARSYVQIVASYLSSGDAESFHKKEHKRLRAQIMALMNGADVLLLPGGTSVKATRGKRAGFTVKPTTTVTLKAYVPGATPPIEPGLARGTARADDLKMAG